MRTEMDPFIGIELRWNQTRVPLLQPMISWVHVTPRRLLRSPWKYNSEWELTDSQSQRHLKDSTVYRQVRPT